MELISLIIGLRNRRVTFSIHDSVAVSDHLWMDMWFWNSEDVKERERQNLPTRVQVSISGQDMEALFRMAMDKLKI